MSNQNPNWDAFVSEVGPALYRYFVIGFDRTRADDLVQETLLRLLRKLRDDRFDSALGSLRMYAFGIAHFVRLENRRGHEHDEYVDHVASENQSVDQAIEAEQSRTQLWQAIAKLSQTQQEILAIYMESECSFEEIGLIVGMPGATVRSHLHRAKQALKLTLNKTQEVEND